MSFIWRKFEYVEQMCRISCCMFMSSEMFSAVSEAQTVTSPDTVQLVRCYDVSGIDSDPPMLSLRLYQTAILSFPSCANFFTISGVHRPLQHRRRHRYPWAPLGRLQCCPRPLSWCGGGLAAPSPRTPAPLLALRVSHSAYPHFMPWRRLCSSVPIKWWLCHRSHYWRRVNERPSPQRLNSVSYSTPFPLQCPGPHLLPQKMFLSTPLCIGYL